jgi:uncharacterized protein (TIGR02757 family)
VPRTRPLRQPALLKERLDRLVETFDLSTISPDPLELVRRYNDPLDQEIAGVIAAAFAYGRADLVVAHVGDALLRMGPSPQSYLARELDPGEAAARFAGFSHRFHKTADLVALLARLSGAIREHGSLGGLFRRSYDAEAPDIAPSLARFVDAVIGNDAPQSLRYLISSPRDGSACKRMNLFLRWMVRRQEPDLGIWDFVDPAKLVMPLDTHIHRISTFLGLNRRKSADWKSARQLTDRLAVFSPSDPTRYDFALCRLGILDKCSRRRRKENCDVCLLLDVCHFPLR